MRTNTTCPTPGGVDPEELDRHIAQMCRDVANEAEGLRRDEYVSFRRARIEELPFEDWSFDAVISDLWAACIAGASQRDLYLQDIAAAGVELRVIQANPGYHFISERAQRMSDKYGAHCVSLLALKPVRASRHASHTDLGGGADVAHAVWEEAPPKPHHINRKDPPMSPYLYRRPMQAKLARLRRQEVSK